MNIVKEIIFKYDLRPDNYNINDTSDKRYEQLIQKWKHKVDLSWYGFELGGVPVSWYDAVDEYLSYYFEKHPNAKIHQIKLKFGGIRIYLSDSDKEDYDDQCYLESVLYDKKLIW